MQDLLTLIAQFGVLPILIYVAFKLHKRVTELNKELKEKNVEVREAEKQNVSLLYKAIAAIKKIQNNE